MDAVSVGDHHRRLGTYLGPGIQHREGRRGHQQPLGLISSSPQQAFLCQDGAQLTGENCVTGQAQRPTAVRQQEEDLELQQPERPKRQRRRSQQRWRHEQWRMADRQNQQWKKGGRWDSFRSTHSGSSDGGGMYERRNSGGRSVRDYGDGGGGYDDGYRGQYHGGFGRGGRGGGRGGGLTAADISLSSGTGPTLNIYANLIKDFFPILLFTPVLMIHGCNLQK